MSTTAARETVTYPAAELDRRFYAFVVDRLLGWGLFALGGYLAWRLFFHEGSTVVGIVVCVAVVLVVSALFAVPLGLAGVSPGKALVGLRLVRDDDGGPVGLPAALLRGLVLGVAALPTVGLGLATLAWTAVVDPGGWRRGLHDRLSHGVVVDVRPVPVEDDPGPERPRQIVNLTAMRLMPAPPQRDRAAVGAVTGRPTVTPPSPASRPVPVPVAPSAPSTPAPSRPAASAAPVAPAPSSAPPVAPPSAPPVSPPVSPAGLPAVPPVPPTPSHRATPAAAAPAPAPATPVPVWRVSFDTGETLEVKGLALVGRRPEPRPGEPVRHLVPLRSSDMSLSKTHAQFQVVPNGALVIMDRGSTNGSVVVRSGVSKPLTAGRPATLLDGDTVRLGDRTMTVQRG
jgi:uncharacterized RDD family membrane protein YckC